MNTIFVNSENSKTFDSHRLLLNLSDKRSDKYVVRSNLSIYDTWKNIKKSYKNNQFKISAPTSNEKFELPDGSQNRITFRIKTGYYFELLKPETMKLLGSTKSKITKDENNKNFSHLQITEVILVHCSNISPL